MSATLKVFHSSPGREAGHHAARASLLVLGVWGNYTPKAQKKASKISPNFISFGRATAGLPGIGPSNGGQGTARFFFGGGENGPAPRR
jgi:hypothetical protein